MREVSSRFTHRNSLCNQRRPEFRVQVFVLKPNVQRPIVEVAAGIGEKFRYLVSLQRIDNYEPGFRMLDVAPVKSKTSPHHLESQLRRGSSIPRTNFLADLIMVRMLQRLGHDTYSCFTSRPRVRAFSKIQTKKNIAR